mmetsp:Transcript_44612/g.71709  ORF Transcript_44612/g.71709 Transcript_44612/m.71709 type:complete len:204 (+) Transcript_44612:181-792(+)
MISSNCFEKICIIILPVLHFLRMRFLGQFKLMLPCLIHHGVMLDFSLFLGSNMHALHFFLHCLIQQLVCRLSLLVKLFLKLEELCLVLANLSFHVVNSNVCALHVLLIFAHDFSSILNISLKFLNCFHNLSILFQRSNPFSQFIFHFLKKSNFILKNSRLLCTLLQFPFLYIDSFCQILEHLFYSLWRLHQLLFQIIILLFHI